ncbi:hypothetical protein OCT63_17030 [Vibrio sp. RW]|uniref:hypothetical protein n=1 Tax=Vibrio sp. RW TaxID=2998833 RepID=UPI0022CDB87B|nr:hypothetical protein [Vibrio sp. RW]MDA0145931.1 hypothetical protein [Vibrio sp. RW]
MFKKLLAYWLLNNAPTLENGVTSLFEKELFYFNLRTNNSPQKIEVPVFIHQEFLKECERKGVTQTDSFAGVPVVVSKADRFIVS